LETFVSQCYGFTHVHLVVYVITFHLHMKLFTTEQHDWILFCKFITSFNHKKPSSA